MSFTDAYGTWEVIASSYQPTQEWIIHSPPVTQYSLLRFRFLTDWGRWKNPYDGYRSMLLIRGHYSNGSGNYDWITGQRTVYVTEEPQLINYPPVQEFTDNPSVIRRLGVRRRFFKNATWIENHPTMDLKFDVTIEAFVS
ncbi:hypothetical protein L1F28_14070 [Arthrospira platensis NCB002]|uniref:hypothetical protein n=1 Tax=Limnospira platensis TaxID=118562 RepID=UPI0001D0E442|nr:hypothetical protein [Arthrospira platensis NCB002]BAI89324.1 hypothetical protein NIES39_C04580 [Arthrospira platensis NIES-39]BDT11708.1 hypothetical protein N39L_14310 [Arthrospira platensis NIES-39]